MAIFGTGIAFGPIGCLAYSSYIFRSAYSGFRGFAGLVNVEATTKVDFGNNAYYSLLLSSLPQR